MLWKCAGLCHVLMCSPGSLRVWCSCSSWGSGGARHTYSAFFLLVLSVPDIWAASKVWTILCFVSCASCLRAKVELRRGRLEEGGREGATTVLETSWKDIEETGSACALALASLGPHWWETDWRTTSESAEFRKITDCGCFYVLAFCFSMCVLSPFPFQIQTFIPSPLMFLSSQIIPTYAVSSFLSCSSHKKRYCHWQQHRSC